MGLDGIPHYGLAFCREPNAARGVVQFSQCRMRLLFDMSPECLTNLSPSVTDILAALNKLQHGNLVFG